MVSPSWTAAIGPPTAASGPTCPMIEAVRPARETPIGDEVNLFTEALSDESARYGEHLAHSGPALRTFVTNDDDVASFDLSPLERSHYLLFLIEHLGRT